MHSPTSRVIGPREAVAILADPVATERCSPLGGTACLAVDLRDGDGADAAALAPYGARLGELPCPTVAIHGDDPTLARLAAPFDVAIPTVEDLTAIVEGAQRAPLAASTLVQLLRSTEHATLHHALVAESAAYGLLQAGPEHRAWLAWRRPREAPPAPDAPRPLRVEHEGDRLVLTLDRPERRNALSVALRDALAEALAVAVADPDVAAIVVRGAGPAFCTGGDLDEFGTHHDPATSHVVRATRNVGRLLAACAARVRFELHGACIGAGIELAAFGGRVSAAPDTTLQLPELSLGLIPGAGGTASLPRRIGRQRTAWLALTGASIDAATAASWGLVDALVRP